MRESFRQRVALVVSCLALLAGGRAQASELSLKDVLQSAEQYHPNMSVAETLVEDAEGRVLEARGGFDLKVYGSGQIHPVGYYQRTMVEIGASQPTALWGTELGAKYTNGLDFAPYDGGNTTSQLGKGVLSVFVPLLRDGPIDERRLGRILAGLQEEIAHQERRALRAKTLGDAARAYYRWALLGAEAEAYRSLLALAEKRHTLLEEQVTRGQVAAIELTDNRRIVAKRRAELERAQLSLQKSALFLSLFLRDDGKRREVTGTHLPEPLTLPLPPSRQDGVMERIDSAPEIEVTRFGLNLLTEELRFARNQGLPRLDLSLELSQSGGTERPYSSLDDSISETTIGGRLSLALDVQRRKARGKVARLEARRRAMTNKLDLARDTLSISAKSALLSLKASRQIALQSRAARTGAEQMATAERERLDLGQSNLFNLNLREEAVQSARVTELQAVVAVHMAWIDLQQILGTDQVEAYLHEIRSNKEGQKR